MSTEENKAVARRLMEEIWNQGNVAVVDEVAAPEFTFNYPLPGLEPNREGYKQTVQGFRAAFQDMEITTDDIVAEGDKVAVRWTGHSVHGGEWMGVAPTGKEVSMTGICWYTIQGGKIVDEWAEMDMLGLMQKLGAVPSSGEAGK